MKEWLRVELNGLKIDYLLLILCIESPRARVIDAFIGNAFRLYKIAAALSDESIHEAGTLAIMGLLDLHNRVVDETSAAEDPLKFEQGNARILLQAAILARRLSAGDAEEHNRPLRLLAARIHLILGLPTIAFEQYRKARVKEMLQDTISYVFLSRISQIHPFDATGFNSFSPDAELSTVINAIQRMEARTDDFLYQDMQNFLYDQAFDLVEFKWRLKGSLTKHLCLIERRRVARLNGVQVDYTFDLNLKGVSVTISEKTRISRFPYHPITH